MAIFFSQILFLTCDPLNELADLFMRQKFIEGIEVTTQLFFFGHETVNFAVAISTD